MPLTHDEIVGLDKLFLRMEKNAKAWTCTRWLMAVSGLVILGMGVWQFGLAQNRWDAVALTDFNHTADTPGSWWVPLSVMAFSQFLTLGLFQVALGGVLVGSAFAHWHKGKQDALLIKMARSWMESQPHDPPADQ